MKPRAIDSEMDSYVPGKSQDEIASEFNLNKDDIIKLGSNENPFGPSAKAIEAIGKECKNINRYPESVLNELQQELANYSGVKQSQVIIGGDGADEIIDVLAKTFIDEGDEFIVPLPSYMYYEYLLQQYGARPVYAKWNLEENKLDTDSILNSINDKTKMIFLCTPNNPTGTLIDEKDIRDMASGNPDVLIVVDEAHRGYILDKEMSETEMLYRNQDDYISKYRTVIEYFDAVKVALTATPALHTTEIFGKPVFNYSYREAVIDGYLVDHDAPHNIKTKLRVEGINYQKGEQLAIYDPVTGEVMNSADLEDDMKFEIDSFNREVITEPFNRTVLNEIAWDLNPDGKGKTLIYAVDDNHADLIVKILKEIYSEGGVDNDAVMKITGSVAGGNKKKISEAIKRFKNESNPKVVVTVDLLTTGIDVPEIVNLVFMRRIKSRILFEQMLGRATRLCPSIGKTNFEIYDPVGVY